MTGPRVDHDDVAASIRIVEDEATLADRVAFALTLLDQCTAPHPLTCECKPCIARHVLMGDDDV